MEYEDFYDIAAYGNDNWKGNYTEKEVACNAYGFYSDFKICKEQSEPTDLMNELLMLLLEDGSENCKYWFWLIMNEIVR